MPLAEALAPGNLPGIGMTVLGVFLFSGCNALAKHLVALYPAGEMLFLQTAVSLVLSPSISRRKSTARKGAGSFARAALSPRRSRALTAASSGERSGARRSRDVRVAVRDSDVGSSIESTCRGSSTRRRRDIRQALRTVR